MSAPQLSGISVRFERSPYKGQPDIAYMECPCGRTLLAHLGRVVCPCGNVYSSTGELLADLCASCLDPRDHHIGMRLGHTTYPTACADHLCPCAEFEARS